MHTPRRYLTRGLLVLALVCAPFASSGGAKKQRNSTTVRKIGPGVYHKKIVRPKKKRVIHMITVRLKRRSSVDVGLAGNELGHVELLSNLAARNGAIAAINGDFGTRERRPWNMYAQDGQLIQTERTWGRALAVDALEDASFIGHPTPRVALVPEDGSRVKVQRVNSTHPGEDEVGLFTSLGRKVEQPPYRACAARLKPTDAATRTASGRMAQRFIVVASRCGYKPMPVYKGIVVATPRLGTRALEIAALAKDQPATLKWSIQLRDALDIIGGNPIIVGGGKILWNEVRNCGYLCERHPRTAVAITGDNRLLLVVVDGRRPRAKGMYLYQLARFLVNNGAERAMTMDGGGASEMWIRGKVVNVPSDGQERPLVNSLLVLPGDDDAQMYLMDEDRGGAGPSSLRAFSPVPEPDADKAFERAAADPGSLGGLADLLQRRGEDIPPYMERIARDLRSNRPLNP